MLDAVANSDIAMLDTAARLLDIAAGKPEIAGKLNAAAEDGCSAIEGVINEAGGKSGPTKLTGLRLEYTGISVDDLGLGPLELGAKV